MLLAFAVANAAAVLALALAAGETRLFGATTRVPALWPYALGLMALGAVLVAGALDHAQRRRVLAAQLLLYALFPASLLLAAADPASASRRWAIGYAVLALVFAAGGFVALWIAAPKLGDGRLARLAAGTMLVTQLILVPYLTFRIAPEADEPHYLVMAQSIGVDGDLDLTDNYDPARYRSFYPGRFPDTHAIPVGSALYPIRDLGLPLVAALPMKLAGRMGVLVFLAVVSALLVAQVYLLLRDLGFSPRVALSATALGAISNPFVTYATQIYPDIIVALAGVTAIRVARKGPAVRGRNAALAAVCIAVLPWLTTRAWLYAIGLAVPLIAFAAFGARAGPAGGVRRLGSLLLVTAPAVAIIAGLLVVNLILFGLPIPGAGFYLIREQQVVLSTEPQFGALGLFFDRTFGIIPRAPIYLLAFLGLPALVSRGGSARPVVVMLASGWFLHFAFVASLEHWHSDWSPPGRNLVATLPFLIAAVAAGLETLARVGRVMPLAWVPVLPAVAWSGLVAVLYCGIPAIRYNLPERIRATGETGKLWLLIQQTVGGFDLGRTLPSIVQHSASAAPLVAVWLTLTCGLIVVGWRLTRTGIPNVRLDTAIR